MYFAVDDLQVFAAAGDAEFDNTKPTLVFLHGSSLDHSFWAAQAEVFAAQDYNVLALDLPGHGRSEGIPLASIESMADWLHAVFDALAIKNISLIAHSQGCLIALEYTSRYPNRIRSISFTASGLATPVNSALLNAAEIDPEAAVDMMLKWGFGPTAHLDHERSPTGSTISMGRAIMLANASCALTADLNACNSYQNGQQAAAAICCPTQVILAENDRMAPHKAGMELVEHLDDPELSIVAESGHMIPLEAPDEIAKLLQDFVLANNAPVRANN